MTNFPLAALKASLLSHSTDCQLSTTASTTMKATTKSFSIHHHIHSNNLTSPPSLLLPSPDGGQPPCDVPFHTQDDYVGPQLLPICHHSRIATNLSFLFYFLVGVFDKNSFNYHHVYYIVFVFLTRDNLNTIQPCSNKQSPSPRNNSLLTTIQFLIGHG